MSDDSCKYHLESKASKLLLFLDCKKCRSSRQKGNGSCIDSIIRTVEHENNINYLLLKNHSLTRFCGKAVDQIKELAKLRQDLQMMYEKRSIKTETSGQGPSKSNTMVSPACLECLIYPPDIYSNLRELLFPGFHEFITVLSTTVANINDRIKVLDKNDSKLVEKGCIKCIGETFKDLTYIFINFQEFCKQVAFEGFMVVVE